MPVAPVKKPDVSYHAFGLIGSLVVKCPLPLRVKLPLSAHVCQRSHGRGAARLVHGRSFPVQMGKNMFPALLYASFPLKQCFAFLAPSDKTDLEELQPFPFFLPQCRNVFLAAAC